MEKGITITLARLRSATLERHWRASDWVNVFYSGTTYSFWKIAHFATAQHSAGRVLDAGSGRGGWADIIEASASVRDSLDVDTKRDDSLTWVADLQRMPEVPSDLYDSVICHQVLEHVRCPWLAIAELYRVIKPGGHLVVSVPHLSRLHELPHDYYRFTPHGLRSILELQGFEIIQETSYGGLITFIHHQFSSLFLSLAQITGPVYPLFVALNTPFTILSVLLDHVIERFNLMPNGVLAVARKPCWSAETKLNA